MIYWKYFMTLNLILFKFCIKFSQEDFFLFKRWQKKTYLEEANPESFWHILKLFVDPSLWRRGSHSSRCGHHIKFFDTFFFQFLNPKGVIVGIIIVSTYVESGNNFINYSFWVILVSFICALISITFWTFVGKFFRRFATNEKFIKIFNYAMASLLLACIGTFYL